MGDLVIVMSNRVLTSSLIISDKLEIEHRAVMFLVNKYKDRKILSTVQLLKVPSKGRPTDVAYLNENQALFIITLMKNSDKVLEFKEALVNAFVEYRSILQQRMVNQKNIEWLENRENTKIMRRTCTDKIQEFVQYAISQGSKSAEKYYMNLSRMELTGLFLLEQKYPNARDVMSIRQLHLIEMADEAIAISLEESMKMGLPYKECYQKAKEKIELLSRIFPKSPLPALLSNQSD